jgi:hypothetical protein
MATDGRSKAIIDTSVLVLLTLGLSRVEMVTSGRSH